MAEVSKSSPKAPDLMEGFQASLKARIDACDEMLEDLEKFRHSAKATRAPRTPKPVSATKQISRVQYLKDSPEYKITSINPVRIVGAHRLLVFSVKYRILYDFYTSSGNGFTIKGTSLKNVDESKTRAIKLRKPEDFLTTVQQRGAKIIEARGASSAASAANAAIDSVNAVWRETPAGDWSSLAVVSRGEYGVPEGLQFGFPVAADGRGGWKVVEGLEHDAFSQERIRITTEELIGERDDVRGLGLIP